MLMSSLSHFSGTWIIVKGTIATVGRGADKAARQQMK